MSGYHSSTNIPVLKKAFPILFVLLCSVHFLHAQRDRISINDGWFFSKAKPQGKGIDTSGLRWEAVTLPHSWNTADVMDDEPGYYRGIGWYRRRIHVPAFKRHKHLALYFEGANQLATVYVNGRKAVTHTGGYNGFYVTIDNLVKEDGLAEILVSVDNSFNEAIAPLTADFTFFGGLYRSVSLISTDPVHFEMPADGGSSVYITTPTVSATAATVKIKSSIVTPEQTGKPKKRNLLLVSEIRDASGLLVSSDTRKLNLAAGIRQEAIQEFKPLPDPHLWNTSDPYLYTVSTRLIDAGTKSVLDEINNPLGFRWYRFSADSGFFLNDQPLKLVGASRHQDRPDLGNAVPSALAREDIGLLKKMGGNFLRVAHYPQDQAILDECDRLGIIASVEIPLVNE
ncbi:MAG: glycoside hydrolase family 2, partial [Chitinophagaceae bacterium]